MDTAVSKVSLMGLARRLVLDGLLSREDAERVQRTAQVEKTPFVVQLVKDGVLTSEKVAAAASAEFGAPLIDLAAVEINPDTAKLVEEKLIRRHHALPVFQRGKVLFVAVSDPTRLDAVDEISFHTRSTVELVVADENKLGRLIDKTLEAMDTSMQSLAGDDMAGLENLEVGDQEIGNDDSAALGSEEAPIVRFVNKVLVDAIRAGASDIHFEPYEKYYRVRTRQDGVLREVARPPIALAPKLAARLKVMSRLDISERRVPQDGRIKLKLSQTRAIDFRVSTCPTLYGEKIVMRILDPSSAKLGIDALGYEPEQKDRYLAALNRPYGMILVTGPTGSGKTVSLYTGVNILNTDDRNISTAEDPIEIQLPGINQVNVNPRVGLTFAGALRSFLRQDPDVILVGEIRDLETAEIAVKAAQTGHLVLSTLHTNDAPKTLTRLADIGIAPYSIATAVNLIIAQRLVRRLCEKCKQPVEVPKEALLKEGFNEKDVDEGMTIFGPGGCDQCTDGYKGRTGIYQVMPVSDAMGRIIMAEGNAIEIADQAKKEGIADLRQSGLKKVKDGITSLEEVNRATIE
ncbi:MAG TPA: type IV-A pilus assembly ATPase PilB [Gammaproteobacteria bacterium]|nr:type IV-A pilus assembly ATPase PilB [Gammaproteobacteria bacterium]